MARLLVFLIFLNSTLLKLYLGLTWPREPRLPSIPKFPLSQQKHRHQKTRILGPIHPHFTLLLGWRFQGREKPRRLGNTLHPLPST